MISVTVAHVEMEAARPAYKLSREYSRTPASVCFARQSCNSSNSSRCSCRCSSSASPAQGSSHIARTRRYRRQGLGDEGTAPSSVCGSSHDWLTSNKWGAELALISQNIKFRLGDDTNLLDTILIHGSKGFAGFAHARVFRL